MKYKDYEGSVNDLILLKLKEIETAHHVKILHAIESGSRAWGFASPDSDYDVRLIYVRPQNDYLKLQPKQDFIEWALDETLDINGWDLSKALQHFHIRRRCLLLFPGCFRCTLVPGCPLLFCCRRCCGHCVSVLFQIE